MVTTTIAMGLGFEALSKTATKIHVIMQNSQKNDLQKTYNLPIEPHNAHFFNEIWVLRCNFGQKSLALLVE